MTNVRQFNACQNYFYTDQEFNTAKLIILSCVATSVSRMHLLHVVAFSKKLRWLDQTKVITLKTKLHAVNGR